MAINPCKIFRQLGDKSQTDRMGAGWNRWIVPILYPSLLRSSDPLESRYNTKLQPPLSHYHLPLTPLTCGR